jgi:sec-independent protein translocase protein TatA
MFRNPIVDAAVVLLIVLLIFGPKRLPELGKGLGSGFREFKDGITGKGPSDEQDRQELTASSSGPTTATTDRDGAEVASPERRS